MKRKTGPKPNPEGVEQEKVSQRRKCSYVSPFCSQPQFPGMVGTSASILVATFLLVASLFGGCGKTASLPSHETPVFISYRDIAGVTAEHDNFPIRFHDTREPELQEIAGEVMREHALIPWIIGVAVLSLCLFLFATVTYIVNLRRHKMTAHQAATLSAIYDSIPVGLFCQDIDGYFTNYNRKFEEVWHIDDSSVMGHKTDWENFYDDTMKEKHMEINRRVISEGITITTQEQITYPNGLSGPIEIVKTPLLQNGKITGLLGIALDISERIAASNYEYANSLSSALTAITKSPAISEGGISESADLIVQQGCSALHASRVGIWITTDNDEIFQSISCYDAFGGQFVAHGDLDLSNHPEYVALLKSERQIVTHEVSKSPVISAVLQEYTSGVCAMLAAPIRADGKLVGAVYVEQDQCELFPQKRDWLLEEQNFTASLADLMTLAISSAERQEARKAAEAANQAKSAFLAMMSHEIRTPMNVIVGVTEILMQSDVLSEEVKDGLIKIYNSSDLLLGIINDILDFSKIEAGKFDILPVQYKIASLINDAVNLNLIRIGDKPIEFELKVDENIPVNLLGDELRIKQILNNLLSNAFKYTEAGKVTLTATSEPNETGVTLIFSVQDTGHGMTKEQVDQLFSEYVRHDTGLQRNIEGTGLGLAITKRLVNLMGGDISVESKKFKGSLFTVRLPQGINDYDVLGKALAENLQHFRTNEAAQKARFQVVRDLMPYGKVLVVDDMETNIYVAVHLMKLYELQIETARSGEEALEKIQSGKVYDVVFMDHMMPGMDGIETTKRMRNLGYLHPIVALTANAVAGQAEVFLHNGFDDFISKPIDLRQLNSVLNKLVRDKHPTEIIAPQQQNDIVEDAADHDNSHVHSNLSPLLLESFIKDARKAMIVLEDVCQNARWGDEGILRSFTITVHGLKSTLANIGEASLSDAAYKLELGGREGNINVLTDLTPKFLDDLRALVKTLESIRETSGIDENIAGLYQKLRTIQEMCATYNQQGILDILEETTNCSKETKAVLDSIMEHIQYHEFEEAENDARSYADVLAVVLGD